MARLSRNRLKTPISIIRQGVPTRSKTGAVVAGQTIKTPAFCELLPISSRDFITAQAQGTSIDAKMHLDYEVDIKVTDKIDVQDGSNLTYEVVGLMPVPQDNKKIVIARAVMEVA